MKPYNEALARTEQQLYAELSAANQGYIDRAVRLSQALLIRWEAYVVRSITSRFFHVSLANTYFVAGEPLIIQKIINPD